MVAQPSGQPGLVVGAPEALEKDGVPPCDWVSEAAVVPPELVARGLWVWAAKADDYDGGSGGDCCYYCC